MPLPQSVESRKSTPLRSLALAVATPIGRAVFGLALLVLYYGLFTPVGFVLRLLGRDALELRPHGSLSTYWKPKSANDGLRADRERP